MIICGQKESRWKEMLKANGGYVKSLVSDEKSLGNIWWNGKYFVTLHRENQSRYSAINHGYQEEI